jgi:hypothetical protein
MKRYTITVVLFGIAALLIAYLWITSSSKTQGAVNGMQLQTVSTAVPMPIIKSNNLILIEFFAGY